MSSEAHATQSVPVKRDHRQEVTDSIVKMLEAGVAPWQKPWQATGMPFNPTTDKAYRGGNAVHLLATAIQRGYDDPRWMTYKQAAQNGYQVKQGEKGTHIEFWDVKEKDRGKDEQAGDQAEKDQRETERRLIHRIYTVFNAKQIEGVPAYEPKGRSTFEAAAAGERILDSSGARISHDQTDKAFYSRSTDSIHLPPKEAFADGAGYYGTALHELAHWTGHPDRLNRPTLNEAYRFGDTNYAKEELRAELASVFLAAELGVPHDPANHAAYVGSWITALKEDKNEIFRAAHDAAAAADFVLALDKGRGTRDSKGERPEAAHAVGENSRFVAREEPGTGTVGVHDKTNGVDQHSPVEVAAKQANGKNAELSASFAAAKAVASDSLGDSAKTYTAQTQSGTYNGPIIGETDHHIVQRLSPRSAVAHMKQLLEALPGKGENVSIAYANDRAQIREVPNRSRSRELAR
jgi:antirestriction protein ArdC